ncbi:aminotransferase class I/II-fold pyridoxal phosphate-dependent enzyme [Aureibaculum sp. 2210JD6-5]|uniref:trans-sulfuration enzyme family protein n=1 Tax=Aureibaculum sp. 2210JD6-5 TaxID=3103957 RepID=UPI002AACA8E3|nr:aminotransferase class I/II-fold pyridoxal phosphate-dependent enzyme [Aureibaculum sp. 2210JD6-5]MDY7396702.1 aminotransferase class I/II-fold pyridoxal phosphate-dependent enzyme [Aureibaculum sp. 2210JD6-5]
MKTKKHGVNTICTHTGGVKDTQFGGAISPVYMATSYPFMDVDSKRYPRYFNTPNQQAVAQKIAALENAEAGLIFGSGMAAISTTLFSFSKQGDHVVLQNEIYGGTFNLIVEEFDKMGIEYSFTNGIETNHFEDKIKPNTKVIYIETPSNPLLSITDIEAVVTLAKKHGILTMIDNTFASPINQTPLELGIDISIHSATKYLGGHSDISAGAVATTQKNIDIIWNKAKNLGGHLSDFIAYLLERSIKTLGVRVDRHNANAQAIAEYLDNHKAIEKVFYPGLKSHPNHDIAKKQMHGFGGMLSFELKSNYDAVSFQNKLKLIKPSMSLAGVESTILLPSLTSHSLLTVEQRKAIGVSDNLLRFSVGIEDVKDIIEDINQAL